METHTLTPEDEKNWIQLIRFLARPGIAWTLHSPQYSAVSKRARLIRLAYEEGLQQAEIARAFNVSQQAVSKAIKRGQNTLHNVQRKPRKREPLGSR
jgi:DNA invertase Pin-like site-specific DNA recombinase